MNPNMKNEKLRSVFEALGYQNVSSVISSGNIIFDADETDVVALEQRIEQALYDTLGITSTTIIRSLQQIQRLIEAQPFGDAQHTATNYLVVTFLQTPPQAPLEIPDKYTIAALYEREVCSIIDSTNKTQPDPTLWLEKNYGKAITSRTWNTVSRIVSKMTNA